MNNAAASFTICIPGDWKFENRMHHNFHILPSKIYFIWYSLIYTRDCVFQLVLK